MWWRTGKSAAAAGLRHRQRAVRAKLATAGLLRKFVRTITPTEILGGEATPSVRLRSVLDGLGPMFSAFGEYLSLRADLLPLADCYELAPPPSGTAATPAGGVRALLQRELGAAAAEPLRALSGPVRTTPLFQWHRAHLEDGTEVTLKILRPEFESQWLRDADLLDALKSVYLIAQDGSEVDIPAALGEFRDYLMRRTDLAAEVDALGRMATAAEDFATFIVPETFPHLCSPRVVTSTAFPGGRLLSAVPPETGAQDGNTEQLRQHVSGVDLGRRLALSWLQQALLGPVYPEGPFDDEILVLSDGRLALTGGLFGRLDNVRRQDLLRYLTAAAKDEADRACDLLLDQCSEADYATPRARMRRIFRQADPFRTAGWSRHYAGQRLADTLFVHWRLTRNNGYRVEAPVEAFTRGLFAVEQQGRRIAPARDGLRQGLDDVRIIAAAVRAREYFGPSRLGENLHQLAEIGSRGLSRLAEASRSKVAIQGHEADGRPRRWTRKCRRDLPFVAAALLLIPVSAVMIAERLPAATPGGPLEAVLYTLMALVLFWYVGRKDNG